MTEITPRMLTAKSLFTYFLLTGALHGFYLCVILFLSRSKNEFGWLLSIVLGAFSIFLFNVWVFRSDFEVLNAYLSGTSMPFLYLVGPAYWLYLQFATGEKDRWRQLDLLHLAPAVICFVAASPYYFMDCQIKLQHIAMLKNNSVSIPIQRGFYFGGQIVQTLFYLFLSFRTVIQFKASMRRQTKEFVAMRSWISGSYVFMVVLTAIYLLSFIGFIFFPDTRWFFNNTFDFSITIFIHLVGFLIIRESLVLSTWSVGGDFVEGGERLDQLRQRIEKLMNEKPYLNPDYSLKDLSAQLETNTVYTSKMVNLAFGRSFTDFINERRIEEAKIHLDSPKDEKLFAIALESGFSNKQTFARVFKKYTGLTPSEYREKIKNQVTIN